MSTATGLYQVGPEGATLNFQGGLTHTIPPGLHTIRDIVNILNEQAGWKKWFVTPDGKKIGWKLDPVPVVKLEVADNER